MPSKSIVFKIILFAVLLICIFYLGLFALMLASWMHNPFPIIALVSIGVLTILVFLTIFFWQKMRKFLIIAWIAFPLLVLSSCFIGHNYQKKRMYDYQIQRVSENDFDLREYQPFIDSTKAVFLNEKSTLSFTDNDSLPILDGATALYPLYSAFAQAVYPKKEYPLEYRYDHYTGSVSSRSYSDSEVQYNNTMYAYQRLIHENDVDIIFVAEPSEEQEGYAKQNGVELKKTVIAKEAFVFFVNAKNPVYDLTIEQIQDIYSGKTTNWKEVGGNDEAIRAFQRNEGSGSQTAFLNFMGETKPIEAIKEDKIRGMGGIIRMVSDYGNYGNAIGFSFRFFTQSMVNSPDIKILKVNGVYPDIEFIKNKQYPITENMYAITNVKNNKPNVTKLLDWILSDQGQYLVEKTGYCPIK